MAGRAQGGAACFYTRLGHFNEFMGGATAGAVRLNMLNNPDNQPRHPGRARGRFGGQKALRQPPLKSGRLLCSITQTPCYVLYIFVCCPKANRLRASGCEAVQDLIINEGRCLHQSPIRPTKQRGGGMNGVM
jgi:hypothetical protein